MDLPTHKGVIIDSPYDESSSLCSNRHAALEKLISWGGLHGVLSRDVAKFVIGENGQVRYVANHFIPANKHLLHVPFSFDISFGSLKTEIHEDKNWSGWSDLRARVKQFEASFAWNPFHFEQKDYFSKNVLLAMAIIGALHKLQKWSHSSERGETPIAATEEKSFLLQTFEHYWKGIREDVGNVLFNWTPAELLCLQGSSLANCLPDARRFGEELYQTVIVPYMEAYPTYFGPVLSLEDYFRINSIILTQSFGTGKREKSALIPIVDLVNGKPLDLHNCTLENCAIQKEINGEFIKFHVLESNCDIEAGEEIFLEYAQVGNGDYLMTYNHLPLDPEVIMNNQKTDVFLDLAEFFETELLRMHPNTPPIRQLKRQHIYGFFNLPKTIPITMEDLFSPQYSCIPSLRQVLIFLQFDEQDAKRSITTGRIKSQLSPHQVHHLFHLFMKFIECTISKPNVALFRALVENKLPASMITALNTSQNATNGSKHSNNATTTTTCRSITTLTSNTTETSIPSTLTENMKSAIFLQISERLVIEVMINRFIHLFPDRVHEFAFSIVREHLISSEVNAIIGELVRPYLIARQSHCFICGSSQNLSKCSRCRQAFYCSAACQKEHWPYHKNICRPAAAAAAAGTTTTTTTATASSAPHQKGSSGNTTSPSTKDVKKVLVSAK